MTDKYKAYLASDEWKKKAAQRLKIDGYRCTMCGSAGTATNPLQIHHLTYKHIYREDVMKDLTTLCKCCHNSVHRMMDRTTGINSDGTVRHGWKDTMIPGAVVVSTDEQTVQMIQEGDRPA